MMAEQKHGHMNSWEFIYWSTSRCQKTNHPEWQTYSTKATPFNPSQSDTIWISIQTFQPNEAILIRITTDSQTNAYSTVNNFINYDPFTFYQGSFLPLK